MWFKVPGSDAVRPTHAWAGRDAWIIWMAVLLTGAGLAVLAVSGGLVVATAVTLRVVLGRARAEREDGASRRIIGWWLVAVASPVVLLPLVASLVAGPEAWVFVVLRALGIVPG